MVDVKTGAEQTTNDFRFTWFPVTKPDSLRMVIPKSYKGMICHFAYDGK